MQESRRALRRFAVPCLLVGMLLAGCDRSSASESEELTGVGVRAREIPKVRVAPVERGAMVQRLETTSVLESEREIDVFPRVAGVVVEILTEEGQPAKEGDVLARLDDRDQVLAVRDAEVALEDAKNSAQVAKLAIEDAAARSENTARRAEQAQRDYERNLKLRDQSVTNVLSEQAVEASRLERDNADAEAKLADIAWRRAKLEEQAATTAVSRATVALQRASVALEYMKITAPFDGVVAQRSVRIGDMVGSSEPAFVLSDTAELRAVFYRPQEELELFTQARREDGLTRLAFEATAEAYAGRVFEGEIERVSPTIDRESGQFRVTARIRSADGRAPLLPGMLVRMSIVTDVHAEALILPKRAIQREGERLFVLAVDEVGDAAPAADAPVEGSADAAVDAPVEAAAKRGEYTVRRVDISEGFSDDERVEIRPIDEADLTAGTLVVIVGSRDLADGDPVDVDLDAPEDAAETEGEGEPTTDAPPDELPEGDAATQDETRDGE